MLDLDDDVKHNIWKSQPCKVIPNNEYVENLSINNTIILPFYYENYYSTFSMKQVLHIIVNICVLNFMVIICSSIMYISFWSLFFFLLYMWCSTFEIWSHRLQTNKPFIISLCIGMRKLFPIQILVIFKRWKW